MNLNFPDAGLPCGNSQDILDSSVPLPWGSDIVSAWMKPVFIVKIVSQEIRNARPYNHEEGIKFMGNVQPFGSQDLMMKSEGERRWKWYRMYSLTNLQLDVDDRIKWKDKFYRIKAIRDYTDYGYLYYEICEDYEKKEDTKVIAGNREEDVWM